MSSPVALCGAGKKQHQRVVERFAASPIRSRAKRACRGAGTSPARAVSAAAACGPETRITAIAAGGRPDDSAKIVSGEDMTYLSVVSML